MESEVETIKIVNQNKHRKEGTPAFNDSLSSPEHSNNSAENPNEQDPKVLFQDTSEKHCEDEQEFNISFTNQNYNPISQRNVVKMDDSNSKHQSKKSNPVVLSKSEQPPLVTQQIGKSNRLIHLSENYNNDNGNFRVTAMDHKVGDGVHKFETTRKKVQDRFGSPVPVKSIKNKMKIMIDNPIANPKHDKQDNSAISFPDLVEEPQKNSQKDYLKEAQKHRKKKKNRVYDTNFKIFELQHNMLQFNGCQNIMFQENGKVIDSDLLREELRAFKINDNRHKKGKLVKPTNPVDMINVQY